MTEGDFNIEDAEFIISNSQYWESRESPKIEMKPPEPNYAGAKKGPAKGNSNNELVKKIEKRKGNKVKWEYKIVTGKLIDISDAQLNELGAEGWEAVGCGVAGRELGPDKMMVLFKRQK